MDPAATSSKMELQQPPKIFCNFLQKGLAKNNLRLAVYSIRTRISTNFGN
jgi:hypothetical protein